MFMNKKMNWLVLSLAAAAVTGVGLIAATPGSNDTSPAKPSDKTADLFGDKVVAKGKGVEVKRSQLDEEVVRIKAQAAARGQAIPPEHMPMIEPQILDQLIQVQLLQSKATESDKVIGKDLAEKRIDEARTRLGSEESFNLRLKAEGLTKEILLAKWTESAIAETVVKRELKADVPDAEVKKYYEDNPARFEQPEMVRASHVLLSTRDSATQKDYPEDKKAAKKKTAEEVLKRARAGEDFAKLAKEFSEDPGSKDKGGEYTFPRGQMVPEFEAAAFSLNPGQVSDIVTTMFGYHIIKLTEKIPAKKVEFAKVSSDLKDALVSQAIQKQIPDYMKKLKQEAGVEILDEKLKVKETPEDGLPAGHPPTGGLPANHPPVSKAPAKK
jgi:peptidyl-prolyl cis-trans isomerase C